MSWYKCLDCGKEYMNKIPCRVCGSEKRKKIETPEGAPKRRRNRIGI
jgi:hypothetical protein